MAKSEADRPIRGLIVESTPAGMTKKQFKQLLDTANALHAEGLMLAGVVQLADAKVGALFVRVRGATGPAPKAEPERSVLTDDDGGGLSGFGGW